MHHPQRSAFGRLEDVDAEGEHRRRAIDEPGEYHGDIAASELHWFDPESQAWLNRDPTSGLREGYAAGDGSPVGGDDAGAARDPDLRPWKVAFDDGDAPFYRWFVGGRTNACFNELDRHVLAGRGGRVALVSRRLLGPGSGPTDPPLPDRPQGGPLPGVPDRPGHAGDLPVIDPGGVRPGPLREERAPRTYCYAGGRERASPDDARREPGSAHAAGPLGGAREPRGDSGGDGENGRRRAPLLRAGAEPAGEPVPFPDLPWQRRHGVTCRAVAGVRSRQGRAPGPRPSMRIPGRRRRIRNALAFPLYKYDCYASCPKAAL